MPRRRSIEATPSHLERRTDWAGLREGDEVDVLDDRERRATWRFAAHVTNTAAGTVWVEVVGGRGGDLRRRSFRPEQVFPRGAVRGGIATASSLADEPRLPF